MSDSTVATETEQEKAIRRAIAQFGSTNELEVSVATKQKPSEVRRTLEALEARHLIRRGAGRSRRFGEAIELTDLGRRSL